MLFRSQDVTSRHRGAKPLRRYELLGGISLLSPEYLLSFANAPIAEKLVEMDELKSMISYLRNVDTTIGWQKQGYSSEKVCFEAILGSAELMAEADQLQKRAEQIQDELDEFNALTKVEIPDN